MLWAICPIRRVRGQTPKTQGLTQCLLIQTMLAVGYGSPERTAEARGRASRVRVGFPEEEVPKPNIHSCCGSI